MSQTNADDATPSVNTSPTINTISAMGAEKPGSLESWLSSRRATLIEKHSFEIAVPGFDNKLFGRYHAPSYRTLRGIAEKNERLDQWLQELYASADILITCCDELYVKDGDERKSLGKWSIEASKKFGVDTTGIDTPRQAILAIFENNDLLLVQHSAELLEAVQKGSGDVDEKLSGESEPGTPGVSD